MIFSGELHRIILRMPAYFSFHWVIFLFHLYFFLCYLSKVPQTEIVNPRHIETKAKKSLIKRKESIYMGEILVGTRKMLDRIDKYEKILKLSHAKLKSLT